MRRFRLLPLLLLGLVAAPSLASAPRPSLQQPDELERLRRDQDDILRKAERLRELMTRLLQRYEREKRSEQAELLRQGLKHLEESGLLQDVAGIRNDLMSQALSEALRKQREVIAELEDLLNILLERKSMENLDEQIARTAEMARTARELERRQAELQRRTDQALRTEASPAERELLQQLLDLARRQAEEAQSNARQAGQRRPSLEAALARVRALLRQQDKLESSAERDLAGEPDPAANLAFRLGELAQRTRDLMAAARDHSRLQDLQRDARELEEALQSGDANGIQEARDRLEARLATAPARPNEAGPREDQELQQIAEQLQQAGRGDTEEERKQLASLAAKARKLAEERAEERAAGNAETAEKLEQDSTATAEEMAGGQEPKPGTPAQSVEQAARAMDRAGRESAEGNSRNAMAELSEALRQLDQARQRLRQQNPDTGARAEKMAGEADRTALDLRNSPQAEQEENAAAEALDRAEEQLRQLAEKLAGNPEQRPAPEPTRDALQGSRANLEQAEGILEQALATAGADRASDMQAAAQRQQQLAEEARNLQQALDRQTAQGTLVPEQNQPAQQAMERARQLMDQANQALQQGRQASASGMQQQAAEALQQAREAIDRNRPLGPEQQQALQRMAQEQQRLEEDIIRLAREAEEQQNRAAQQALQQAAQASQRARQAMQDGDADEARQQQEQARQKLEEAAEALEEERDRYMDLRQEELLFRIKEELQQFLEQQRPITEATREAQEIAERGRLSRPQRRKLNQMAEEEQELAGRLEFITKALEEEGTLVFSFVLRSNKEDLEEVSRRLSGRAPDPGPYTTMLQEDVEKRTLDLLAALERERKRREEERQQQQQQGQNRFNPQRERLVSMIAELKMLKQLERDIQSSAEQMKALVEARGGDAISDAEAALIERLGHRHNEITAMFLKIKQMMEQALQQQGEEQGEGRDGGGR